MVLGEGRGNDSIRIVEQMEQKYESAIEITFGDFKADSMPSILHIAFLRLTSSFFVGASGTCEGPNDRNGMGASSDSLQSACVTNPFVCPFSIRLLERGKKCGRTECETHTRDEFNLPGTLKLNKTFPLSLSLSLLFFARFSCLNSMHTLASFIFAVHSSELDGVVALISRSCHNLRRNGGRWG